MLEKTLGVPLFQEQAMKVAIVGAGFTPAEADALRRSMATFKTTGGVSHFRDKMIGGMIAQRLYPGFRRADLQADRGLRQLRLPRKPRRELRQDRLRLVLDEALSSGHLLRGFAQRPADGLLRARPAGPRRAGAWRRDAPGLRQREPLGLHAGDLVIPAKPGSQDARALSQSTRALRRGDVLLPSASACAW